VLNLIANVCVLLIILGNLSVVWLIMQ